MYTQQTVKLSPILLDFPAPIIIKTAVIPGDKSVESLFTVTDKGLISIVKHDKDWCLETFLDVSDLLIKLHGLEFHERFEENGRFYLHYTTNGQFDTVEEWLYPKTKVPLCIRTLINIKTEGYSCSRDSLKWIGGRLMLILGNKMLDKTINISGKAMVINVDKDEWEFENNPFPITSLEELDLVRQSCVDIVAEGINCPTGLEVDGKTNYLMDDELKVFIGWRRDLAKLESDCSFTLPPSSNYVSGKVYYGNRMEWLKGNYIFANGKGTIYSLDDDLCIEVLLKETSRSSRFITAIGTNQRKTRLFVGGKGGLYEILAK